MKAVIMAGGEGTRLRPLTCDLPKPLTPVLGESVMSHALRLLKKHSVTDAAVTLMFMPEAVTGKYGGEFEGVNLNYFLEEQPLGTAGSVGNAKKFLLDKKVAAHEDFFIIISGDAVCDIDLSRAAEFHKKMNADATIILTRSQLPLEFGVVLTERCESGRISSFIEKPAWSQVFSDAVNTGIYILNNSLLELIPEGKPYDFGKDLFPRLLRDNYKMFGYVSDDYWCDVGDIEAYFSCNAAALRGDINIIRGSAGYKSYVRSFGGDGANNLVYIGKNTSSGAKISGGAIIGADCVIKDGTLVNNCIIHDGVKIGANCRINSSIICENVEIGDNVTIESGCVVGAGTVIHSGAVIRGDVKIWNKKIIEEGTKVMTDVIFSPARRELFCDEGIRGSVEGTLTPEYCVKIGAAGGGAASGKGCTGRIGVMHCGGAGAKLIHDALLCGIVSSGAKSYDFGEGFRSLASFAAGHFKLDALFYVDESDGVNIIRLFDRNTLQPPRSFERKFEAALSRDDLKRANGSAVYETEIFSGLTFLYFSELIKSCPGGLSGFKINIPNSDNSGSPAHIVKKALIELGAEISESREAPVIRLSSDGMEISISQGNDVLIDFWHIAAILEKHAAENGLNEIALPYLAPHALGRIAERHGANVYRYLSCPFDESDENDTKAKSIVFSQLFLKDPCFAAVRIMFLLHKSGLSLGELVKKQELPEFYFSIDEKEAEDKYKTVVMRELNSRAGEYNKIKSSEVCSCGSCAGDLSDPRRSEGVRLNYKNGFVYIVPKRVGGFRLFSEAVNAEAAREMVSLTDKRIKEIIAAEKRRA